MRRRASSSARSRRRRAKRPAKKRPSAQQDGISEGSPSSAQAARASELHPPPMAARRHRRAPSSHPPPSQAATSLDQDAGIPSHAGVFERRLARQGSREETIIGTYQSVVTTMTASAFSTRPVRYACLRERFPGQNRPIACSVSHSVRTPTSYIGGGRGREPRPRPDRPEVTHCPRPASPARGDRPIAANCFFVGQNRQHTSRCRTATASGGSVDTVPAGIQSHRQETEHSFPLRLETGSGRSPRHLRRR